MSTRNAARKVLGRALLRAEQENLILRNVAAIADGPKVPKKEGRSLTVDEARILIAALASERLGTAYLLALALGLRRGEVLGRAGSLSTSMPPRRSCTFAASSCAAQAGAGCWPS